MREVENAVCLSSASPGESVRGSRQQIQELIIFYRQAAKGDKERAGFKLLLVLKLGVLGALAVKKTKLLNIQAAKGDKFSDQKIKVVIFLCAFAASREKILKKDSREGAKTQSF